MRPVRLRTTRRKKKRKETEKAVQPLFSSMDMSEENNMDVEISLEEKKPSFEIAASVLHILDYSAHVTVLSDASMNLEDDLIGRLVTRLVRRAHRDSDGHAGIFEADASYPALLDQLNQGSLSFTAFSKKTAERFDEALRDQTVKTLDLFVNSYHYDDVPYVSLIFLEGQSSLAPFTGSENGLAVNTIEEKRGILPSLNKKIASYAVINVLSHEMRINDAIKWDTEEKNVLASVLQCSMKQSQKEVLKNLTEVADEVARDYDENPAVAVSKAKQYIADAVKEERPVETREIAEEIFPGEENRERQEAFLHRSTEREVPEEVAIEPSAIKAGMKKQRIATDTGIEISFPTEYTADPDMISFVNEEDGSISISIHHIGKITNKN